MLDAMRSRLAALGGKMAQLSNMNRAKVTKEALELTLGTATVLAGAAGGGAALAKALGGSTPTTPSAQVSVYEPVEGAAHAAFRAGPGSDKPYQVIVQTRAPVDVMDVRAGAGTSAQASSSGPRAGPVKRSNPASYYITQNRTRWNPHGSINANCGPTSLAMDAVAYHVLHLNPNRSNAEALIEYERRLMTGRDNIHSGTSVNQVIRGAHREGMRAYAVRNLGQLDYALRHGRMVIAMGNPGAYGKHPGWHFILVVGRTRSGGYIINDPAYEGRPGVVISRWQMLRYFRGGAAVYR